MLQADGNLLVRTNIRAPKNCSSEEDPRAVKMKHQIILLTLVKMII